MPAMKDEVIEAIQNNPDELSAPTSKDLPVVLTVDECASILRVNRKTIYEMASKQQLPGVIRVGRKLRISTEAMLEWLRNGQSRPLKASRRRS